jgi:magnesium transporter
MRYRRIAHLDRLGRATDEPAAARTLRAVGTPDDRFWVISISDGKTRRLTGEEIHDIDRLRGEPNAMVWLNVRDPEDADLDVLQREFDLHPLALEDVRKRRQRPKVDTYPDQHMIVAYEAIMPETGRDFRLGELHLFAGPGWLISVHLAESPAVESVRERFEQGSVAVSGSGGGLLYAILDAAADSFFPLLDHMTERIERLEDQVLSGDAGTPILRRMLRIKRDLLDLRRVLAPMRDVANALLRRDIVLVDDAMVPYFQDLFDHLVRILDQLDLDRNLLASVLDARLTVTSNSLNAIMKRLTAVTVVLMIPTLIAGIYGMNFDLMPELDWALGYPFALVLMAVASGGALWFFRSHDWF